ncbi:MAG: NUDIX domain-containing protein [Deltaproteobacteria bacterium]|nr:NUDIX domain-containing protein [Deltaproteobacteria bacterium]
MANAFESGARKVIPAVLVYLERDGRLLMLHRDAKPGDYHAGKVNGLGGKLEPGESPLEAAAREVAEEAGVTLAPERYRVLGVLQFPNFKAHKNEDWLVYVLTAELRAGETAWEKGPEGALAWVDKKDVPQLNLWAGDRHFIPYVVEGKPFVGTLWYEGQAVRRYWIAPLSQLS